MFQSMNAETGELIHQERFDLRDRVYASMSFGDDKLYSTLRDGTTLVLRATPIYEELAVNQLGAEGEQFNATPAIVESTLIIRSTDHLYRIGEVNR